MNLPIKIERSIKRSERAYNFYLQDKMYFQALRIYKANSILYGLLEEFVFVCEEKHLDEVFHYLFHLEDWFENFEVNRLSKPALEDIFIFERQKKSPSFPDNFIKSVLKK